MDLPLTVTSAEHPWFLQAKKAAANGFTEHYIWKSARPADGDVSFSSVFAESAFSSTGPK